MARKRKRDIPQQPVKEFWENLQLAQKELGEGIVKQSILISELAKTHEEIINSDKEISDSVNGLSLAIRDVADAARLTSIKHSTKTSTREIPTVGTITLPTEMRKGLVTDDDKLDYLGIAGEYITHAEELAHISTTGYVDIFSKLKISDTAVNNITEIGEDGTKLVKDAASKKDK